MSTYQRRASSRRPRCENMSGLALPRSTGLRPTFAFDHETNHATASPTSFGERVPSRGWHKKATTTPGTNADKHSHTQESRFSPPFTFRQSATTGKTRLASWSGRRSMIARATSAARNPQARRIPKDRQTAAAPPGEMEAPSTPASSRTPGEAQAGQHHHPRLREDDEIQRRSPAQREHPLPGERLDGAPHLSVISAFSAARRRSDVTVGAEAGKGVAPPAGPLLSLKARARRQGFRHSSRRHATPVGGQWSPPGRAAFFAPWK